jgi:hypothetical protein
MKQQIFILIPILFFLFMSCQDEDKGIPAKRLIQFSYKAENQNSGGRTKDTATPAAVLLTLTDNEGSVIEQNKKLPLYAFGSSFTSEGFQLTVGNYVLTQFVVLDAADEIIYVAPLEGSDKAQFVSDPLPINFSVSENGSTTITPQVLAVNEIDTPENFGYVSFGFEVVQTQITLNVEWTESWGVDSVVVALHNGTTTLTRHLSVQSDPQKRANTVIPLSELGGTGSCLNCWYVEVSIFFEPFDGEWSPIQNEFHLYEKRFQKSLMFSNVPKAITINNEIEVDYIESSESTAAIWNTYHHVVAPNNFSFVFNKDNSCDPYFEYRINNNTENYIRFDRAFFNTAEDNMIPLAYGYAEYTFTPGHLPEGYPTIYGFNDNTLSMGNEWFIDINSACGLQWNYADQVVYITVGSEMYSYYFSWYKTENEGGRIKQRSIPTLEMRKAWTN